MLSPTLRQAIKDKDVGFLCWYHFRYRFSAKQQLIIRKIAFAEDPKLIISAMTRYGKSRAVAAGISLFILFHRGKKICFVAPKREQSEILRNYLAEMMIRCPALLRLADLSARGAERLKSETSKTRQTFKNGCEYRVFSAHHEADALMGFGGDVVIVDEACLISPAAWTKILRMLGDNPKGAILIILMNPWDPKGFPFKAWSDPEFTKIKVGWQEAVLEGRTTEKHVLWMKSKLPAAAFTVLYESEFPEGGINQLIPYSCIEEAAKRVIEFPKKPNGEYLERVWKDLGIDIARFGNDSTVFTPVERTEKQVIVKWQTAYDHNRTTATAGAAIALNQEEHFETIKTDDNGIGGGVTDNLYEADLNVMAFIASEKASNDKVFANRKAEAAWYLRELFITGEISIPDDPRLKEDLMNITYEYDSTGRLRIVDPEEKSPDFFDSLVIAVENRQFVMVSSRWMK